MKILLINGQGGTGKTSVAIALKNKIPNSAHIDADSLGSVNPFVFDQVTDLIHQNALSLIGNFTKAGYETVVTSGLTRNQEQLDAFTSLFGPEIEFVLLWLRADRETRMSRKVGRGRDASDTPEWFEFGDKVYPDVENFNMKRGISLEVDTSSKSVDEVVAEIEGLL